MATNTITGEDTLVIYDRVLTDMADGDVSTITFPNDLVTMKTGKNGNTIFFKNANGINAEAVIRVNKGSSDDRFLQGKLDAQQRDFASSSLAAGSFVKRLGDGQGSVVSEVYVMGGGVIYKGVESKDNVEGDTTQAVSVYNMRFAQAVRSMQ
ncbi:hypothetical protein [Dyadobacter psychrotolerans]|uniref:Uncharacterized protein n=1 Tax=Dyadobacter psychrotolerans TaxID=2541721 RepID=A0A4R5E194_9BACT|nr:hypothetical protein [Dyadobacter psychrotolerans]TDE17715.1 hypothetical protein E0F88_07440 [Dyadobacter psychrotolerans]